MPRSKDPSNYPKEYLDIIDTVVKKEQVFRIPGVDGPDARKLIANYTAGFLYSLTILQNRIKDATQKWAMTPTMKGEFPVSPEDRYWLDILEQARQMTVELELSASEAGKYDIVFRPKSRGFYSSTLRQGRAEPAAPIVHEPTPWEKELNERLIAAAREAGQRIITERAAGYGARGVVQAPAESSDSQRDPQPTGDADGAKV